MTDLRERQLTVILFPVSSQQQKAPDEKEKKKEIVILDMKRSQQINIALTKLPPVNSLKQAILSMDNSVLDKEALEVSLLVVYS